jgi:DtxR family Mn-dependent transcriptional regulator
VRNHELWECFLYEYLKLPWTEVHDHACRLEHATDDVVTDALDAFMGFPQRCPHGNSIPSRDGQVTDQPFISLGELDCGQSAVVEAIFPEQHDLLVYLDSHGLRPGQVVTLEEIAPFGGPLMLRVDQNVVALGDEAAQHIFVSVVGDDER